MNRSVRVVLVRPRNPLNIGACARAMANFGLSQLTVMDPYEPVWQETRSAPEAEKVVLEAQRVDSWEEAVQGCVVIIGSSSFHQRPLDHAIIELPNLGRFLSSYPASAPVALVLGSERSGLSNEELVKCHAVLHIPTSPATPSMNLGQSLAVILYEWRRLGWDPAPPAALSPTQLEEWITVLGDAGDALDYPPGFSPTARMGRIRAILKDTALTPAAVRYLMSFTRHVLKRERKTRGQA